MIRRTCQCDMYPGKWHWYVISRGVILREGYRFSRMAAWDMAGAVRDAMRGVPR